MRIWIIWDSFLFSTPCTHMPCVLLPNSLKQSLCSYGSVLCFPSSILCIRENARVKGSETQSVLEMPHSFLNTPCYWSPYGVSWQFINVNQLPQIKFKAIRTRMKKLASVSLVISHFDNSMSFSVNEIQIIYLSCHHIPFSFFRFYWIHSESEPLQ